MQWASNKEYSDNVLLDGMKLVDIFYNEMEKNKDIISQVRCYADIEENMKAGENVRNSHW